MSLYIEDSSLLAFFLRTKITDPRDRIQLTESDTQTLTDDTIVSVTAIEKISHVDNLQLNSTLLTAFVDYYYDIKNRKIVFFEGQTGELTFDIYTGTNWIQPGPTRKQDLSKDSFPRISIFYVSRVPERLGNFKSCKVTNNRIQIDTWAKKDFTATIDIGGYTSNLAGDELALYLGKQVEDNLDNNTDELITNKHFIDYNQVEAHKLNEFTVDLNLSSCKYEFFIKSINTYDSAGTVGENTGGEDAPEL